MPDNLHCHTVMRLVLPRDVSGSLGELRAFLAAAEDWPDSTPLRTAPARLLINAPEEAVVLRIERDERAGTRHEPGPVTERGQQALHAMPGDDDVLPCCHRTSVPGDVATYDPKEVTCRGNATTQDVLDGVQTLRQALDELVTALGPGLAGLVSAGARESAEPLTEGTADGPEDREPYAPAAELLPDNRRETRGPTRRRWPLLLTGDDRLRQAFGRISGRHTYGGTAPTEQEWADADLVFAGGDVDLSHLPPREGITIVAFDDVDDATRAGLFRTALSVRARHVAFLPQAEPWLRSLLNFAAADPAYVHHWKPGGWKRAEDAAVPARTYCCGLLLDARTLTSDIGDNDKIDCPGHVWPFPFDKDCPACGRQGTTDPARRCGTCGLSRSDRAGGVRGATRPIADPEYLHVWVPGTARTRCCGLPVNETTPWTDQGDPDVTCPFWLHDIQGVSKSGRTAVELRDVEEAFDSIVTSALGAGLLPAPGFTVTDVARAVLKAIGRDRDKRRIDAMLGNDPAADSYAVKGPGVPRSAMLRMSIREREGDRIVGELMEDVDYPGEPEMAERWATAVDAVQAIMRGDADKWAREHTAQDRVIFQMRRELERALFPDTDGPANFTWFRLCEIASTKARAVPQLRADLFAVMYPTYEDNHVTMEQLLDVIRLWRGIVVRHAPSPMPPAPRTPTPTTATEATS
jgi:hypothetical protein